MIPPTPTRMILTPLPDKDGDECDVRHIVQVIKFPETANGKTDRNALPDPLESDRCSASEETEADPADDDDNDGEGSEYDRNEDEAKREAPSK